jgi:hypothetical protein
MRPGHAPPAQQLPSWLTGPRPRWLKLTGSILGVTIVGVCLYFLSRQLAAGLRQVPLRQLRPAAWPVVASLALTVLCEGLGAGYGP